MNASYNHLEDFVQSYLERMSVSIMNENRQFAGQIESSTVKNSGNVKEPVNNTKIDKVHTTKMVSF